MLESYRPHQENDQPVDYAKQLRIKLERYATEVHSPELITETWQGVFDYWVNDAKNRGVNVPVINVPDLELQQGDLEKPVKDIDGNFLPTVMIYYPPELQGKEGLVTMGETFPMLHTRTVKPTTPLSNMQEYSGWLNAEATLEAPNGDTDESQLRNHFDQLGRVGMNENQYIILSEFMKLTVGNFVDNRILCRLLGSEMEGQVINAHFGKDGDLHVNSHLRPSLRGWELGGRSVAKNAP